jgi:molybdopterin molybdotransferase
MGVQQALSGLLDGLRPLPAVPVEVDEALGLVLAQSLVSEEMHPAEDTSAMDGYAVHSFSLRHACPESPVRLRLAEDIRAGYPPEREVGQGMCSRISTGGLIPVGADAVEMREHVQVEGDEVVFRQPIDAKTNIRFAGEHLQVGEEVLHPGTVLSSAELGMAAYLGAYELLCYPRLPVAILATGSELIEGRAALGRGQVRDSNGVALAGALRQLGCTVAMRQRVADDPEALDRAIEEASGKARVLLTSGGISAGWHDLVRERIEGSGGTFHFHKLRMRPGKPIAFGRLGEMWVFCLPGNPVSSLVTFQVFVKPALLKLMGRAWQPVVVQAVLQEPISKKKGFTVFFRVRLEDGPEGKKTARLSGPQASHQLKSLVAANGLLVAGEEVEELAAGTQVEVQLI